MLRLMLLRHAKSSWSDPELRDHERPLNGRGRKAAVIMGRYMAGRGLVPEVILCSPAKRTRQTLALALPDAAETSFLEELYDFGDGEAIIDALHRIPDAPSPVLVIGHNPSMEGAALLLAAPDSGPDRERMAKKYPTAALAVIDLPIGKWDQIEPGIGEIVSFTTPRELGG